MQVDDPTHPGGLVEAAFDALIAGDLSAALRELRLAAKVPDRGEEAQAYIEAVEHIQHLWPDASSPSPLNGEVVGDLIDLARCAADHGRFSVALALLRHVRDEAPTDQRVPPAIREVGTLYYAWLASELGDLELVPHQVGEVPAEHAERWADVVDLVNGTSTCQEIIDTCVLGRLATLRLIVEMKRVGAIRMSRPSPTSHPHCRQRKQTLEFTAEGPVGSSVADTPRDHDGRDFDMLFSKATAAYLRRNYDEAMAYFETCAEIRPGDTRVAYNLKQLQKRSGNK